MQQPYYEKPSFILYHANCLDILAGISENSADMVFADPPYFLSGTGLPSILVGELTLIRESGTKVVA